MKSAPSSICTRLAASARYVAALAATPSMCAMTSP
jgi:hypothetical protein